MTQLLAQVGWAGRDQSLDLIRGLGTGFDRARAGHPQGPDGLDASVAEFRHHRRPIAQVARVLGVNEGTLGNWVARDREKRQNTDDLSTGDIEELKRLRAEVAELRMERDVLIGPVRERVRAVAW